MTINSLVCYRNELILQT